MRPHVLTSRSVVTFVAIFSVALPSVARAQSASEPQKVLEIDAFRTPTSPAFTLLGVSPTAVARPNTPRALATELISSSRGGSVIPDNYAIEVAPYWLASRPQLSFAQYTDPSPSQSFAQSLAFSLATSRPDSSSDTASTRVAFGLRVQPLGGHPSAKFRQLLATLDSIQRSGRITEVRKQADAADSVDVLTALTAELRGDLAAATLANDPAKITAARAKIAAASASLRDVRDTLAAVEARLKVQADSMKSLATAMGKSDAERVGTFLELAAAASAAYPGGNFDAGKFDRAGVWATMTYRLESPHLDLIGVGRVLRDVRDRAQNAVDVGGRALYVSNALGLSAEWVNRTAFGVDAVSTTGSTSRVVLNLSSSNRLVAVVDYRAADATYITMSFGQDFKSPGVERRPLVAALGLQLLYGDKPVVKLP